MKKYNATSPLSLQVCTVPGICNILQNIAKAYGVTFHGKEINVVCDQTVFPYTVDDGFILPIGWTPEHVQDDAQIWYATIELTDEDAEKFGESRCVCDVVISRFRF